MSASEDGRKELELLLTRTPVLGDLHPLIPLALSQSVQVLKDGEDLVGQLDDQSVFPQAPLLILHHDQRLRARFPTLQLKEHPSIEDVNRNMHFHLEYAREQLLTTRKIADEIVQDVIIHRYDVVIVMLVDGLSYGDLADWSGNIRPCFVDGPSVTYQTNADKTKVIQSIGFPSIVGSPSLYSRLNPLGYRNAIGFTYWAPDSNVISDALFEHIPTRRVANFEAVLAELRAVSLKHPIYIQIVREGLDGLAHSKRELARSEIEGAILAIKQDVERLLEVLGAQRLSACLFLVADHGILWKTEHDWKLLALSGSKPRYTNSRPEEWAVEHTTRFDCDGQPYYVLHYPYLGSRIKADDSGVHGGLSYQESLVPFAKLEVK